MTKFLSVLMVLILVFSACSSNSEALEPVVSEIKNSSVKKCFYHIYSEEEIAAMTDEEYRIAARTMGYTTKQLDYIGGFLNEGMLTRAHILMPLEMNEEIHTRSSYNDERVLGTFYFDSELLGSYDGTVGFAYIIYMDRFRIIPEILNDSLDYGIFGTWDYVFVDSDGVRFYSVDQFSGPYLNWKIPKQEGEHKYGYTQLGVSISENFERVVIFYADIPDDFDVIYEGREPDLNSTYQICILNSAGYEINFDTGIKLMVEFEGIPDCVRPDYIRCDGSTVLFSLGEKNYIYDYKNGTLKEI